MLMFQLHKENSNRVFMQDSMPPNDWMGRGYQWVTLTHPFSAEKHSAYFCVSAVKSGNARVSFSLVEMTPSEYNPLVEMEASFDPQGIMEKCFALQTGGTGKVHILARLHGEPGNLYINSLYWLPLHARLLEALNIKLPYSL